MSDRERFASRRGAASVAGAAAGADAALPPSRGHDVLVAIGLALGPAVALGLARFAYALLLSPMRASLDWSFATAGAMNTTNAVGYLIGALLAAAVIRWCGHKRVFVLSVAATGVFLAASAATGNLWVLLVLRGMVGITGAAGFVAGGALATQLGHGKPAGRSAALLGIYFGGGGIGIVLSGLGIPPLLGALGPDAGWRWGWVLLGALTVATLVAVIPATRRAPAPEVSAGGTGRRFPTRAIAATLAGYVLFGGGYIAYMTFIVAYLESGGAGTVEISTFWAVLGLAAIAGGFAWGPMIGRLRGGRGVAVLMGIVTAGAAVPLASDAAGFAFVSAVLFGVSFLAVVAAVMTVGRRVLRPDQWTVAIATLTTGFAVGQCVGPILGGVLSDSADGTRAGLIFSAVVLAAGALISLAQPARPKSATAPTGTPAPRPASTRPDT